MLYILHQGNNPGLAYTGGQSPLVHLQADLNRVLQWADVERRRYAFSKGNAGARFTQFFAEPRRIDELNWTAIQAMDWRNPDIKEAKQAEFLVEQSFPWELVELVGVIGGAVAEQVRDALRGAAHRPTVEVRRQWYY